MLAGEGRDGSSPVGKVRPLVLYGGGGARSPPMMQTGVCTARGRHSIKNETCRRRYEAFSFVREWYNPHPSLDATSASTAWDIRSLRRNGNMSHKKRSLLMPGGGIAGSPPRPLPTEYKEPTLLVLLPACAPLKAYQGRCTTASKPCLNAISPAGHVFLTGHWR